MIHKYEKADGTIIVSGEINNYSDFRSCVCGCSENKEQQQILCKFGTDNPAAWGDYMFRIAKEYYLQEQKKRTDNWLNS